MHAGTQTSRTTLSCGHEGTPEAKRALGYCVGAAPYYREIFTNPPKAAESIWASSMAAWSSGAE